MAIDFEKEVQCYLENKDDYNVITQLINSSEKNKLLDEVDRKADEIERLKLEIRIQKDREKKIINSLIEVLDSIEWFSRVAKPLSNGALNVTIENTNKKIKNTLMPIGLTQINEVNDIFNYNLHNCVDVTEDFNKDNNVISEVLRAGYIYKGNIIRTADVIVVQNE